MTPHWARALVQELRKIDAEEKPHGLYGLRGSRRVGPRLPKLASLLVAPPIGLLKRIGVAPGGGLNSQTFSFTVAGPRDVLIDIETHADTKVRAFGDTFRLDRHTSPPNRPAPDLRTLLPKLSSRLFQTREEYPYSFGLLFIGHYSKQRDLSAFLAPVVEADFLERYSLRNCGDTWQDGHGRTFWSTVQLWSAEQEQETRPSTP